MNTDWAFLDYPAPIPFAHRGGAGEFPENTTAAFEAAVAMGYRYIETDVQSSADGMMVCHHDLGLERATGHQADIHDMTWRELQSLDVEGEPLVLLEDVIGSLPEVKFNIDSKRDEWVRPLIGVLTRTNSFDRVNIAAFSDKRLRTVRRLTKHSVCTSMGPLEILRLRASSLGLKAGEFSAQCCQVPTHVGKMKLVDERFITEAHRRGLKVHVWTINDPSVMHSLLDLGVDGIMTAMPSTLKKVLQERGQWVNSR